MGNLSHGINGSSYYSHGRGQKMFSAYAKVTSPVIYTTAAGTGGPLLWNGSTNMVAALIAVGIGVTTASGVASALGITGNSGQSSAPTSTTAIDGGPSNLWIGGPSPGCSVYRVGTPTNAGNFFQPLYGLGTGATTVDNQDMSWVDIGGAILVPPNSWIALAAAATATSAVISAGIVWAEFPL